MNTPTTTLLAIPCFCHNVNEIKIKNQQYALIPYNYTLLWVKPSYIGIFPVYLGMPLIFTDFQQCTWLRHTSCWKICEYQCHPLGILEKFQYSLALPSTKYNSLLDIPTVTPIDMGPVN